ncbi:11759_t:CDS:1, partial [Dentiscutata heterogama]
MSFLHQEQHQQGQKQPKKRGPYTTKACTNCRKKHAKCTGKAFCERCTRLNLECTFDNSGQKRGPKKNGKLSEEVNDLNDLRNDFDRNPMLVSAVSNAMQSHVSTLSSPLGYPQPNNFDEFIHYDAYDEQTIQDFQEVGRFLYQTRTDTEYIMPNNDLLNNSSTNNN